MKSLAKSLQNPAKKKVMIAGNPAFQPAGN